MKISTFRARDMREVLKKVKEALGSDAVILSTRSMRDPDSGFALGRTVIEVTACPSPATKEGASTQTSEPIGRERAQHAERGATGRAGSPPSPGLFSRVVDDPIEYPEAEPPEGRRVGRGYDEGGEGVVDLPPEVPTPFPEPVSAGRMEGHALAGTPNGLGALMADSGDVMSLDAEGKRQYSWLLMHGVEEPLARRIAVMDRPGPQRGLAVAFQRALKFRDPLDGSARVITLVGPTGVGKTTTLAKIAADLILNRQRSVGMITLDTFRVGAVAQLETYAKLLQVRLVVARSLSEVKAGLISMNRFDYVLVDTVGSSPYNRRQVNSTASLLPVMGEGREVILCMAANVREAEQHAIYRRFSILNPTGLIFTKLDETVTYGGILNVSIKANLPLTLYTDGQRVPENLGWMSAKALAEWFERDDSQEEWASDP